MPNIKSAIKRVRIIEKKTDANTMVKTAYKTAMKNFKKEVESGNKEKAQESFLTATKAVDQACAKGVIKSNTAARRKSSLAKLLNTVK
jgi:small subunit ribosomal protein S20